MLEKSNVLMVLQMCWRSRTPTIGNCSV